MNITALPDDWAETMVASNPNPPEMTYCFTATQLRAMKEATIRATMQYCWSNAYHPNIPDFDAVIAAADNGEPT